MPGALQQEPTKTVDVGLSGKIKLSTTYRIEDALTGDSLSQEFFTEGGAEAHMSAAKIRKKYPAAFVNKVKK